MPRLSNTFLFPSEIAKLLNSTACLTQSPHGLNRPPPTYVNTLNPSPPVSSAVPTSSAAIPRTNLPISLTWTTATPSAPQSTSLSFVTTQPWSPVTPTTTYQLSPQVVASHDWPEHPILSTSPITPVLSPTTSLPLSTKPVPFPTIPLSRSSGPLSTSLMPLHLSNVPLSGATCSTPSPSTWQRSKDLLLMLSTYASLHDVPVAQRNSALELLSAILPSILSSEQPGREGFPHVSSPSTSTTSLLTSTLGPTSTLPDLPPTLPVTSALACFPSNTSTPSLIPFPTSSMGGHSYLCTGVSSVHNAPPTDVPSAKIAQFKIPAGVTSTFSSGVPLTTFSSRVISGATTRVPTVSFSGFQSGTSIGYSAPHDSTGHSASHDSTGHSASHDSTGHSASRDSTGHSAPRDSTGHSAPHSRSSLSPHSVDFVPSTLSSVVSAGYSSLHDCSNLSPRHHSIPCSLPTGPGSNPPATRPSGVARQPVTSSGLSATAAKPMLAGDSLPSPPTPSAKGTPSSLPVPSRVSPPKTLNLAPSPWPIPTSNVSPPNILAISSQVPATLLSANRSTSFNSLASALPTWMVSSSTLPTYSPASFRLPLEGTGECSSGEGSVHRGATGAVLRSRSTVTLRSENAQTSVSRSDMTLGSGDTMICRSGSGLATEPGSVLTLESGGRPVTLGHGGTSITGCQSTMMPTFVPPTTSTESAAVNTKCKREVLRYVHEMNINRTPKPLLEGSIKSPDLENLKSPFSTPLGPKEEFLYPGHWEECRSPYHCGTLKSPANGAELPKSASVGSRVLAQNEQHAHLGSPSGIHPDFRSPSGVHADFRPPVGVLPSIGSSPAGLCASLGSPTPRHIHGILSPSIGHPDVQAMQSKRRKSSLSELPPVLTKRAREGSTSDDGPFTPTTTTSGSESATSPSAIKWPPGGQALDFSHLSVGEMENLYRENVDLLVKQKLLLKVIELQLVKAKHGHEVYKSQLKHLVQPEVRNEEYTGWLSDWSDLNSSPPAAKCVSDLYALYGDTK